MLTARERTDEQAIKNSGKTRSLFPLTAVRATPSIDGKRKPVTLIIYESIATGLKVDFRYAIAASWHEEGKPKGDMEYCPVKQLRENYQTSRKALDSLAADLNNGTITIEWDKKNGVYVVPQHRKE